MKKFIVLFLLFLPACSQGPNFNKESVVIEKTVYGKGVAEYRLDRLKNKNGVRGDGASVVFKAPESFATVGDKIVFKDGKLFAEKWRE